MEVAIEQAAQSRSRRSKWQFMGTSDAGAKEELHRDSNLELPPAVSYFGDEYTFNLETQEMLVHSKRHLFYAVVYLPQKVSDSMLVSRTTWEGGQYNRDEKSRLDALCLAMELGADHIDVELQLLHLIGYNFFFWVLFSSFVLLFGLVSSASDTLTTCLAPPLLSNGKLTQLLPLPHLPFLFVPSPSTRLSSFPIVIPPFSLNQFPSTNSTSTPL
ncbi:unnamed protein product [Lactuca saligna]|uniref:Uncharacterized protein n=1 Tax=Lactuca saligna TaxID=75948 RepID=A0AA35VEG5_LACSI|nr:unnamed protein product [Lactuca saligna]